MALVSDVVFSMLVLGTGVFAASTIAFAVLWIRTRERAIRAERGGAPVTGGDVRMERLEQAMDGIAVEVERMAEGQRFVTKLLAERPAEERDAGARAARVATR